jgi:Fe2+ transport system protein FeoA
VTRSEARSDAAASPPTLADLPAGASARVERVEGSPAVVQRLQEMGLTPGVTVEVVRFAPLGDPMEIRLRGYLLSLRRGDARGVRLDARRPAPGTLPA